MRRIGLRFVFFAVNPDFLNGFCGTRVADATGLGHDIQEATDLTDEEVGACKSALESAAFTLNID